MKETEIVYSVACRGSDKVPGHGGWYGKAGDRCARCGREVFVIQAMCLIDMGGCR